SACVATTPAAASVGRAGPAAALGTAGAECARPASVASAGGICVSSSANSRVTRRRPTTRAARARDGIGDTVVSFPAYERATSRRRIAAIEYEEIVFTYLNAAETRNGTSLCF